MIEPGIDGTGEIVEKDLEKLEMNIDLQPVVLTQEEERRNMKEEVRGRAIE
jgi:hypothetical protein